MDWSSPPWPPAPTERMRQAEAMDWSPPPWAKPPLDKVSLIALITAIPGFGLVSIPMGIWGVIRTKNHQRRGRTLAVISFVLIGLWAIVGTVLSPRPPSRRHRSPRPPSRPPSRRRRSPLRRLRAISRTGHCARRKGCTGTS